MGRVLVSMSLVAVVAAALVPSLACQAQTTAQPIPAGFDFPADQATLIQFRDDQDVPKMRKHAWMVFAGITQPTAAGEAIWETWHPVPDTFAQPGPGPLAPPPRRVFAPPRQLQGPGPLAPGASLLSFVLFNQEAHDWIRSKQFYSTTKLDALLAAFTPSTPIDKRRIEDFPVKAMSLKTAWWVVKKTGITPMPVWDSPAIANVDAAHPFESWDRIVGIDPTRTTVPAGETASLNFPTSADPSRTAKVYPLNKLYFFEVTAANVNSFAGMPVNAQPVVGDFVALVGLHYTTKEIPNWIWATFWWHDAPAAGAFGADRPTEVAGVWQNYLMDVAYDMDTPKEADNTPNAVFNPWIESFGKGTVSNCMTCHQRAARKNGTFFPVTRGAMPTTDPYFATRIQTDFMWSVVLEPQ